MIVLAVFGTLVALGWSACVVCANGMASSPQPFEGAGSIALVWAGAIALWLAWGVG